MVVKTILFKWPHCCELVGPLSWSYIEDTILKQASWSSGSYHLSASSSAMSPESPGSRLGCGVLTGLWISRPLMLRIFTENDGKARFFINIVLKKGQPLLCLSLSLLVSSSSSSPSLLFSVSLSSRNSYTAQNAGLSLQPPLPPQSPQCWDHKHVPPLRTNFSNSLEVLLHRIKKKAGIIFQLQWTNKQAIPQKLS